MRQVLVAGEESQERPSLLGNMVADSAAQHRVAGFERVEDRALRDSTLDLKFDLAADVRQRPQMLRQYDADHGSVCTSTESTGGRSRTMGAQLSQIGRASCRERG